jgi:hypothetical protein
LRKLFQYAVEEISKPIGQEAFISGETAQKMYFVLSGYLSYTRDKLGEERKSTGHFRETEPPQEVSTNQWCSEPALWIKWKHMGNLLATSNCELIALKTAKVCEVLGQLREDEDQVKRYVKIFVRYFKKFPHLLHDAMTDMELVADMTRQAFEGDDDEDLEDFLESVGHRNSVAGRRASGNGHKNSLFGTLSTRASGMANNIRLSKSPRPSGVMENQDDSESRQRKSTASSFGAGMTTARGSMARLLSIVPGGKFFSSRPESPRPVSPAGGNRNSKNSIRNSKNSNCSLASSLASTGNEAWTSGNS